MRSCTSTFRNVCIEILNNLSVTQKNIGTHFIRCIRADLKKEPWGFNRYIVKQQVKALGIIETACTRQEGYAYRIPFQEFLRRYVILFSLMYIIFFVDVIRPVVARATLM